MKKLKYSGTLVMNRETFFLYRFAYSEKQAKERMVKAIAKKHEVLPVVVYTYLKEHPDCFKIEEVI